MPQGTLQRPAIVRGRMTRGRTLPGTTVGQQRDTRVFAVAAATPHIRSRPAPDARLKNPLFPLRWLLAILTDDGSIDIAAVEKSGNPRAVGASVRQTLPYDG